MSLVRSYWSTLRFGFGPASIMPKNYYSFIKDMHVKKKSVPTPTYDPEQVNTLNDMDPYQRAHYRFLGDRPPPIKGDMRDIGYYPNVPDLPHIFRPKYPDLPYDNPQARTYRGEPIYENWEVVNTLSPDIDPRYTTSGMLTITVAVLGSLLAFCLLCQHYDEPYKRVMAVPRTLYIADPFYKQFEDKAVHSVRAWPNYKDYIGPSKYPTSTAPVPSYFDHRVAKLSSP